MGQFIFGGIIGVLGVLALYAAGQAKDGTFYYVGIAAFLFAFFYIMAMVKRSYDRAEERP